MMAALAGEALAERADRLQARSCCNIVQILNYSGCGGPWPTHGRADLCVWKAFGTSAKHVGQCNASKVLLQSFKLARHLTHSSATTAAGQRQANLAKAWRALPCPKHGVYVCVFGTCLGGQATRQPDANGQDHCMVGASSGSLQAYLFYGCFLEGFWEVCLRNMFWTLFTDLTHHVLENIPSIHSPLPRK